MQQNDTQPDADRFEDLDPEPMRRSHRREALFGVLLLGAVLLFAGWNWLHGVIAADAYQQGLSAQQAQHWSEAQAAFAAAGDYADAPAHAAVTAGKVAFLEQTYARLQADLQAKNWLSAWKFGQAISAVQADYRDVVALTKQAYGGLFGPGAQGLIYLQKSGTEPGLYLVGADGGALPLPGSTADSRVLATAAMDGRFVYNATIGPVDNDLVCVPGAERRPTPTPQTRVVLAAPDANGSPDAQMLPASFNPAAGYWLSKGGLWGSTGDGHLTYFDTASGLLSSGPVLAPGSLVIGAAAQQDSLLLVSATKDGAGNQALRAARVSPDGAMVQAAPVPGFLLSADYSPDGAYAALLMGNVTALGASRILYLVNFAAPARAAQVLDSITWQGMVVAAEIRAAFLPGSPTTLLVEHQDSDGLAVRRISLADGVTTLLWRGDDMMGRDDHSGLGTAGLALRTQLDGRPYLAWVPAGAGRDAVTVPIGVAEGQNVDAQVAPRGAFLVYRVRNPDGLDKGTTEAIWSLSAPPAAGAQPELLALARRQYDSAYPIMALPQAGQVLAYITPSGELMLRTLDGAASSMIATGVEGVWSPGASIVSGDLANTAAQGN